MSQWVEELTGSKEVKCVDVSWAMKARKESSASKANKLSRNGLGV